MTISEWHQIESKVMIHRILLQRASICLADNRYQNQIPISNNRFLQSYRSARPWKRPIGEQFPASFQNTDFPVACFDCNNWNGLESEHVYFALWHQSKKAYKGLF